MKALTLTEPWATLVALGQKQIETRGWSTPHRGPLAIHAAKTMPDWARALVERDPFVDALDGYGVTKPFHFGCVIATCNLGDVVKITRFVEMPPDPEYQFGNYEMGRFMWKLANVKRIDPVPARGSLGLWEWGGA